MASSATTQETEELILLLLEPSQAGKTTAANFIAGYELFPVKEEQSTTQMTKVVQKDTTLRLIRSIGLDVTTKSKEEVLVHLCKAILTASDAGGVHAFLICINLQSTPLVGTDVVNALTDLGQFNPIWSHFMLLFMNAGILTETGVNRTGDFDKFTSSLRCPPELKWLIDSVGQPILLLESQDIWNEAENLSLGGCANIDGMIIVDWVKTFASRQGVYTNPKFEEARECWEEYKVYCQEKKKYIRDCLEPSYEELAIEIVQKSGGILLGNLPFSHILRGIKEIRRCFRETTKSEDVCLL
jgi:hypothetical protein